MILNWMPYRFQYQSQIAIQGAAGLALTCIRRRVPRCSPVFLAVPAVISAIAFATTMACASPIVPPAFYGAGYFTGQPSFNAPGDYAGVHDGVNYNFVLTPQYLRSFASVSSSGPKNAGADPYAVAGYYFEILGPNANDIPLSITYSMSVLAAAYKDPYESTAAYAQADIRYPVTPSNQDPSGVHEQSISAFAYGGTQDAHSVVNTITTTLTANKRYFVALESEGSLNNTDFSGTCCYAAKTEAIVDPYLQISSTFTNAYQYTIIFSPGVQNGNPPSVPEPPTLWLLGAGVIGLGLVRRRRHARDGVTQKKRGQV